MFVPINGFTRESILERLNTKNNGSQCTFTYPSGEVSSCFSDMEGNHCAIGCFLPEEVLEGVMLESAEDLLFFHPELEDFMPLSDEGLEELQKVHDNFKSGDLREDLNTWVLNNVEGN